MDTNNCRPTQGGIEDGDWRLQLHPDCRSWIVEKIMETLKRHLPVSGQEGLNELRKIAVRFEEKIFTAATDQSDYLRKISLKMLTMEMKTQHPMGNSLPSNPINDIEDPELEYLSELSTKMIEEEWSWEKVMDFIANIK
ncbi:hypothetical protein IC582_000293 [Cucumis melo]|uniref:Mediator of RNA polymerase II transcription subunit 15a n=1 Tax=Cucumis melo TaxID=3656 RepID=A0A1S4E0G0_CUCME|nr:mediator of RNA polymerase II transcription subunit 15a [Cucumis melo]